MRVRADHPRQDELAAAVNRLVARARLNLRRPFDYAVINDSQICALDRCRIERN